jgi:hypothetical protein
MWIPDPLGRVVPLSNLYKTVYEWNVGDDNALPSWLTAPAGTVSFPARLSAGGRGLCRVTTGAVIGDLAELELAHTINLAAAGLVGVEWTIGGLSFSAQSGYDAEISMTDDASVGVAFHETDAGSDFAQLVYNGIGGTSSYSEYALRMTGPKSVTLVASPASGDIGALRADKDLHYLKRTGFATGAVSPRIRIRAQSAVARFMEIGYIALRLWTT